MSLTYKHGTYGEFAASIAGVATQSGTLAVYVGTAPVNLIKGYSDKGIINGPVLLKDFVAVKRYMGYSEDWATFTLCEAFKAHFDNTAGNAGPIIAINILDPTTHRKLAETTTALSFVNGRATLKSDKIILDTLTLADKVEGTDFSVDYDFSKSQVIIDSIGSTKITGTVNASYYEVDTSAIDEDDIIGGVTSGGVYTGLGVVSLVYQEHNLIPNLIVAPGWSDKPKVYEAMITAGTKINGHWDAFVLADLPLTSSNSAVDTVEKAISWASTNGYNNERSKTFWPQFADTQGKIYHGSTLCAWRMQLVDSEHNGIPMETPSNKAVPIAKQYFGASATNRGFDQSRANDLNEKGISTAVYWGGQWVLWGGHTAGYTFAAVVDRRRIFDNNIRMMMYITNRFQQKWALTIDEPMTRSLADTIKNREQEDADALVAVGALIGTPTVTFEETTNSTDELVEGNFVWDFSATPTPQFKSGTMRVAYTDAGFTTYFGEEA